MFYMINIYLLCKKYVNCLIPFYIGEGMENIHISRDQFYSYIHTHTYILVIIYLLYFVKFELLLIKFHIWQNTLSLLFSL